MLSKNNTNNVNFFKTFDWIVKVAILATGVILWVQNQGDAKYYSKDLGKNLQVQINEIKYEIKSIKKDNKKLLEGLSRIEGKLDQ